MLTAHIIKNSEKLVFAIFLRKTLFQHTINLNIQYGGIMEKQILNNYYNIEPLVVNSELNKISNLLKNIPNVKIDRLFNKDELLYKGKIVFIKEDLCLNKIPFIKSSIINECNIQNKIKNGDLNSFVKLIDIHIKNTHPFNIPVIFNNNLEIEKGYFNPIYIGNENKIIKLVFSEYVLTNKLSILTPLIYAHEIIHSQLEYNNSINRYLNYELLPIFFDKLTAAYLDHSYKLLRTNELLRLKILRKAITILQKDNLSILHKINASMAISSVLQAENLFDKYLYGTNNDKCNILSMIQKVFDGKIQVEDLLNQTEVSIQNSQNYQLIKRKYDYYIKI